MIDGYIYGGHYATRVTARTSTVANHKNMIRNFEKNQNSESDSFFQKGLSASLSFTS